MREGAIFIFLIGTLVVCLMFITSPDPSGTAAPETPEDCFVFEEGELISHNSVGQYGQDYNYVCQNEAGQYLFCQPTYVECE